MKKFLLCFVTGFLSLILPVSNIYATNYYVDASVANNATQIGTLTAPWRTIAQVNARAYSGTPFVAGDTIFFRRGNTYTGAVLDIVNSGTAGAPIVFSSYGQGTTPLFTFINTSNASTNRQAINISNVSNVVIDSIEIRDITMNVSDHAVLANIGQGIWLYNSSNVAIRNTAISLVGFGINIYTCNNITINQCNIQNLREVVSDAAQWNDRGAIAVLIDRSSNNTITYNNFNECYANSIDYGFDGGGVELNGACSFNRIMYNTVSNSDGFLQINSWTSGDVSRDNIAAYNLLVNNGRVLWVNYGGTLTLENLQFYNNDIIETAMSRNNYPYLLGTFSANNNAANQLVFRNNIFWINTNIPIVAPPSWNQPTFISSTFSHQNNIYQNGPAELGLTLHSSETEVLPTATIFTNTAHTNPLLWNYNLAGGSLAIDYGQNLNIFSDFARRPVASGAAPDAGILEMQFVTLPVTFIAFNATAKKEGNMLQWKVGQGIANATFMIEKSTDGKKFLPIATIHSEKGKTAYSYTDVAPSDKNYYRITVNEQAYKIYSPIAMVTTKETAGIKLYPNPVIDKAIVQINGYYQTATAIHITNAAGVPVSVYHFTEGESSKTLNLSALRPGMYFITLKGQSNKVLQQTSFIKQ